MNQLTIQQAFDLALQHHQSGRLRDAEQLYRLVLEKQPTHIVALHHLGVLAHQTERNDVAVDLIRSAIALNPNWPEAHSNLGNILRANGQLDEAIAACREAIALRPDYAEAHNNLGFTLKDKGQLDEAIAAYRQAILLRPTFAEAHNNLGIALMEQGQIDDAITAYRQAINLRPNYAEAHGNLGNALQNLGQVAEAMVAYRQAIALKPNYAKAHSNVGNVLKDIGQYDHAIAAFRQAIASQPNLAEAHHGLASVLLMRGEFEQGWQEYEWRWKCVEFSSNAPIFTQPLWDGCPLQGRSILLHAEQGFGDAIQFIRYVPLLAQRGGKIIIKCRAEIQRLLQSMANGCQVVTGNEPLPNFDFHCPLLSLPRIFGTTLTNIPHAMPYLHPDPEDKGRWQERLVEYSSVVKVGLVWAGSSGHKNDRNRSMKLAKLAPLSRVSGVRLFSLQKGTAAEEAKTPPADMELIDWTDELKDFADTAALIANLDVIIAVDTAVVHLAGAMGKPTWTLLPSVADWRWLLEREDSPWYPSMRLFRQIRPANWDGVVERVAGALSQPS